MELFKTNFERKAIPCMKENVVFISQLQINNLIDVCLYIVYKTYSYYLNVY
jgi:hypothetical protein